LSGFVTAVIGPGVDLIIAPGPVFAQRKKTCRAKHDWPHFWPPDSYRICVLVLLAARQQSSISKMALPLPVRKNHHGTRRAFESQNNAFMRLPANDSQQT
jgi:hypothetical protein